MEKHERQDDKNKQGTTNIMAGNNWISIKTIDDDIKDDMHDVV